jgi:hypothetical protein
MAPPSDPALELDFIADTAGRTLSSGFDDVYSVNSFKIPLVHASPPFITSRCAGNNRQNFHKIIVLEKISQARN